MAVRPGQGPGVITWALRHARACRGALEIIASGLEWADPHVVLRGVGYQLLAAGSDVPVAMRTVAPGMADALAQARARSAGQPTGGVDLIVLGSRSGRLDRTEAVALIAIAAASACPVVIVPADWRAESNDEAAIITEALAAAGVSEEFVERVCAGTAPVRIVPTSFADETRRAVSA